MPRNLETIVIEARLPRGARPGTLGTTSIGLRGADYNRIHALSREVNIPMTELMHIALKEFFKRISIQRAEAARIAGIPDNRKP